MDQDGATGMSRRDFLAWIAAAAALIAAPGCSEQFQSSGESHRSRSRRGIAYASVRHQGTGTADFISVPGNNEAVPYIPGDGYMVVGASEQPVDAIRTTYVMPAQPTYAVQRPAAPAAPGAGGARIVRASTGKVQAIGRNTWGATPAVPGKMKAMGGVTRITIHHEGSTPNNDVTPAQVAATLRRVQSQHRKRMGAGDIGYHFIIDRTGTIWQGRDWQYQGAHTSGANANNLGVMLLGNFEEQQPTAAQLAALHSLTGSLVRKYGLNPSKDIYGHSDFRNTKCPGKYLKPQVQVMRVGLR
ncbi:MAG: peptidoglycan recognition protein family protein [Planctomycetota bacterium]|nr:peptidoglycan recognition protein family protein [Planctomycetota bacterium]